MSTCGFILYVYPHRKLSERHFYRFGYNLGHVYGGAFHTPLYVNEALWYVSQTGTCYLKLLEGFIASLLKNSIVYEDGSWFQSASTHSTRFCGDNMLNITKRITQIALIMLVRTLVYQAVSLCYLYLLASIAVNSTIVNAQV